MTNDEQNQDQDAPATGDSFMLEDGNQGAPMPEATESQEVGLGSETPKIPPVLEGQPEPISEPKGAGITTPIEAPSGLPSEPKASEATNRSFIKNLLAKAGEKIQFNKSKKLEKIMEFVRQKGSVENADVEKLLRVSHSTASRYLSQLVEENKLRISGKSVDSKYFLLP